MIHFNYKLTNSVILPAANEQSEMCFAARARNPKKKLLRNRKIHGFLP